MQFYPAIDLKDGQCVRLYKGEMTQATVFNDSPADQAKVFQHAGCNWIHIVDLNGAFAGQSVNTKAIQAILADTTVSTQLGGGIRTLADIAYWLDQGITRIILGTVAVKNPDLVHKAAKSFPGQIAVGIDARNSIVAVEGWAEETKMNVTDLARSFEDAGISAIIYTDINRDGAMQGVNIEATAALAHAVNIPVIASGGVSSLADLQAIRDCDAPIEGVISGRAVYDGTIDLSKAIKVLS